MTQNSRFFHRLRAFCFILNVVLPLLILAIATILNGSSSEVLAGWTLVGTLPVTGVYWSILFLNFSPRIPRDNYKLLLPFFISLAFGLILGGFQSTWHGFVIEASIVYTALNLCFLSGLAQLFFLKVKGRGPGRFLKYSLVYLIFLIFLGVPAVFLASMGLEFMPLNRWGVAIYCAQVALMYFLYHPMLVQLYRMNKA